MNEIKFTLYECRIIYINNESINLLDILAMLCNKLNVLLTQESTSRTYSSFEFGIKLIYSSYATAILINSYFKKNIFKLYSFLKIK